jgi:hypothetical protein
MVEGVPADLRREIVQLGGGGLLEIDWARLGVAVERLGSGCLEGRVRARR